MNIQIWFPLGLTGLISLLSKGLSRILSSTTIQKHQVFGAVWLCNPINYSPQGSSVHRILQARILEWVALSFSRVSSLPGIEPESPELQADSLLSEPPGKPNIVNVCVCEFYKEKGIFHCQTCCIGNINKNSSGGTFGSAHEEQGSPHSILITS